jgi:hypothetical protein
VDDTLAKVSTGDVSGAADEVYVLPRPYEPRLTGSAAELSTLLETVETTLNGLPDSLTDVPAVVCRPCCIRLHFVPRRHDTDNVG